MRGSCRQIVSQNFPAKSVNVIVSSLSGATLYRRVATTAAIEKRAVVVSLTERRDLPDEIVFGGANDVRQLRVKRDGISVDYHSRQRSRSLGAIDYTGMTARSISIDVWAIVSAREKSKIRKLHVADVQSLVENNFEIDQKV